MKNILIVLAALLLSVSPAHAGILSINYPGLKITSPDTPSSVENIPGVCDEQSVLIDYNNPATPVYYWMTNCATTPGLKQFYPLPASQVQGLVTSAVSNDSSVSGTTAADALNNLSSGLALKFNSPSGSSSQCIRGDGSIGTCPVSSVAASAVTNDSSVSGTTVKDALNNLLTAVNAKLSSPTASTFQTATRSLNTCFQISSTNDADFHYGVDVAIALSLGTNTVAVTSYTNSGCTTGAVTETSSQDNGVGLGVTRTMRLDGSLQANHWAKITATTTGGIGSTVTLRADQREITHP